MCRLKPKAFDFTKIRAHVCEMELSASLTPVNPIAKGFIMHKDTFLILHKAHFFDFLL
jgi:hypothetical protein